MIMKSPYHLLDTAESLYRNSVTDFNEKGKFRMNPLKKPKANFKRKVAKATGIPTTKSGRKRKSNRIQGYILIGVIVFLFYIFSK